jgi:hypothetical protein
MKKLASVVAFSLVLASFVGASGSLRATFNPEGYFLPMESVRNVSRVRWILLSEYLQTNRRGPMHVELRIGNRTSWITFAQASLIIDGEQLRFATKVRNGVRYDFDGRFLPTDAERSGGKFADDRNSSVPALRGVLRTYRGNRIVRSEQLIFIYTIGD